MTALPAEEVPEPSTDAGVSVTVVVPARNERAFIGPCLQSILAQTHRDMQILVVDGASTDGTPDCVEEYRRRDGRIELLHNPRALIPISLNLALMHARGRWLVRIDAHARVPPDYVATAVEHLEQGRWSGVGGRKDGVGLTPAGKAIAAAMASPFGVGNSAYHYAETPRRADHVPFGAYDVTVVRSLGGWDERLAVNQDFEFDHRLRRSGHELLLDPAMVVQWHCRQTIGDLFEQYRRYGQGKAQVARLHPKSVRLRHLAAPFLVVSWLIATVLTGAGRFRQACALVAPYLLALGLASFRVQRTLDEPDSRKFLPSAFVAMHAGWGLGFWEGAFKLLQRGARDHRECAPPTHLR